MVVILTPISLPHDIQQQTIYTIVSKPVRRLELVWGRMIGFMALVTALLAIFGGVSLAYLNRTISTTDAATRAAADRERKVGHVPEALALERQADQLITRMAARVPIKGSLIFFDSKGDDEAQGRQRRHGDGVSQPHRGGDPSRGPLAIRRGARPGSTPATIVDRRIPVAQLLKAGTLEDAEDRLADAEGRGGRRPPPEGRGRQGRRHRRAWPSAERELADRVKELETARERLDHVRRRVGGEGPRRGGVEAAGPGRRHPQGIGRDALAADPAGDDLQHLPHDQGQGHRPGGPRRSQGGEPPDAARSVTRLFPVREYYTNRIEVPAKLLVGSGGRLNVEVRCLDPQQYLGMAESDLYILQSRGSFAANYIKGLSGVWLQAMVLTAIGVWAGTFLSWPVALLMTIFFFVAGQVAFGFLQEFAMLGPPDAGRRPLRVADPRCSATRTCRTTSRRPPPS